MPQHSQPLDLKTIQNAREVLEGQTIHTPVIDIRQTEMQAALPKGCAAVMKLELMQMAGSFKARGAFLSIKGLTTDQRRAGVVAASGGNHALALAWAAQAAGVSAKITLPRHADPVRIQGCKDLGAEVILCDDIAAAFALMTRIETDENRTMIHPFEGYGMSLGAATCAAEYHQDVADLDIVVLPVGGGGLISGMAAAFKQLNPNIKIYGVEPNGADSVFQSMKAGKPVTLDKVDTIADSLGAPHALPYSFGLIQEHVDEIVHVSDDELRAAMGIMNRSLKLMPEPACAASFAGASGPLRMICEGKKIGLLACGSNISPQRFSELLA